MPKLKLTTICTSVLLLISTSIHAQRKQQFSATGCEILLGDDLKVIHTDTIQKATIIIDTARKEISVIDNNSNAVITWFKVVTTDYLDTGDGFPIITYKCLEKGVKTADIILPASTAFGKKSFFDLYIKTALILTPVIYHFYLEVLLK